MSRAPSARFLLVIPSFKLSRQFLDSGIPERTGGKRIDPCGKRGPIIVTAGQLQSIDCGRDPR